MEQYILKSTIVAEIKRRIFVLEANKSVISMLAGGMFVNEFKDLLSFINTLEVKEIGVDLGVPQGDKSVKYIIDIKTFEVKNVEEEPVSNGLEQAANDYVGHAPEIDEDLSVYSNREAFKAGAQWQKEQMIDKACKWLKSYRQDTPDGIGYIAGIIDDKTIKEFKQAIEE